MQGVREMLLLCPDRSVRVAMRGFYLHLLGILAEAEGDRCGSGFVDNVCLCSNSIRGNG